MNRRERIGGTVIAWERSRGFALQVRLDDGRQVIATYERRKHPWGCVIGRRVQVSVPLGQGGISKILVWDYSRAAGDNGPVGEEHV